MNEFPSSEPSFDSAPNHPMPADQRLAQAVAQGEARTAMSATPWLIALLGWTFVVAFHDLSGGAKFDGTDCWVAQTAREMQDRGEWILPYFSGEERLQKSPGPYWAVMVASYLRGKPIDEVAARIPNSLAVVGLVGVVFWLTRRIAGVRAAVFAGFATASSGMILYWAGRGASDLGMTFFSTLSLAALWVGIADEPPGRRRNLFILLAYFAAGLCMLYKMPMPLVTVGIPAIGSLVIQKRWQTLKNPIHVFGLLLFLLPWLPWIFAVVGKIDGNWSLALAKWRVEYVDRMTGDLPNVEANKQWFFYLFYVGLAFAYLFPFSASLPGAAVRAFRRDPNVNRDGRIFMAIWFLSLLAFFTISTGKEARYFLPAMPPLFVMLGIELAWFFDPARPANRKGALAATVALAIILPVGGVVGAQKLAGKYNSAREAFLWADLRMPYVVLCCIASVGCVVAAALFLRGRRNASFGALVATIWVGWFWGWSNLAPVVRAQSADLSFSRQLRSLVDAVPGVTGHLYQVAQQNPTIIWHSNVRFPRVVNPLELLEAQDGQRDLDREMRLIAETMIRKLSGDELALMVATREHYLMFDYQAPDFASELGIQMPKTYLWIQSETGPERHQTVLFGNRPPPFEEPRLDPWPFHWGQPSPTTRSANSTGDDAGGPDPR